jgi:hypothetical protein
MKTVESPLTKTMNKSPGYDPDPASLSTSYDLLLRDYDKALADRKIILNDKSLSEEVRIVHLRKSNQSTT